MGMAAEIGAGCGRDRTADAASGSPIASAMGIETEIDAGCGRDRTADAVTLSGDGIVPLTR
jgi:hypothetical protein